MNEKKTIVACVLLAAASVAMADTYVAIGDAGLGGVGYDYSIGRTEVSLAQWQLSGVGGGNAGASSEGTNAPVVSISWHEAAQYCNWLTSGNVNTGAYTIAAGKVSLITDHDSAAMDALVLQHNTVYVLPTEAEWRKAAYFTGSGFSLYANGTGTAPVDEVDAVYGRTAGAGSWAVGDGTLEQNGTLNMMGSVWEWMESTYGGEAYNAANDAQQMAFRGGDYFLGAGFLSETTRATDDRGSSFNIGLRVVAIPEPGTISLMSLSTISLFLTRTIRRRKLLGKSLLPIGHGRFCDTFSADEEWGAAVTEVSGSDYFAEHKKAAKARLVSVLEIIHARCNSLDRNFWNRMVEVHERRVVRRAAFKRRVINGFDSFLALIMK